MDKTELVEGLFAIQHAIHRHTKCDSNIQKKNQNETIGFMCRLHQALQQCRTLVASKQWPFNWPSNERRRTKLSRSASQFAAVNFSSRSSEMIHVQCAFLRCNAYWFISARHRGNRLLFFPASRETVCPGKKMWTNKHKCVGNYCETIRAWLISVFASSNIAHDVWVFE